MDAIKVLRNCRPSFTIVYSEDNRHTKLSNRRTPYIAVTHFGVWLLFSRKKQPHMILARKTTRAATIILCHKKAVPHYWDCPFFMSCVGLSLSYHRHITSIRPPYHSIFHITVISPPCDRYITTVSPAVTPAWFMVPLRISIRRFFLWRTHYVF